MMTQLNLKKLNLFNIAVTIIFLLIVLWVSVLFKPVRIALILFLLTIGIAWFIGKGIQTGLIEYKRLMDETNHTQNKHL